MNINELSDDCLLRVFQLLGALERVRNERVCRRWQRLLPATFLGLRRLDIAEFITTTYKIHQHIDNISLTPTIVGLLRRCGPSLVELSFGQRWIKIPQPVIDSLQRYCRRLQRLDLGCVILHADISRALQQLAPRLQRFSLNETHWIDDADAGRIAPLLPAMTGLRQLQLRHVPFSLDILDQLPDCLESIDLRDTRQLTITALQSFLAGRLVLRQLRLSNFQQMLPITVELIGCLPALRTLELSCLHTDCLDMTPLSGLTSLEELIMQANQSLDDVSFRSICTLCQRLTTLSITNCKRLRDYGALASCGRLVKLHVENTPQICDADLEDLAVNETLQSITLKQCANIGSTGLLALAGRCPLQEICVTLCAKVDDETLFALVANHRTIPNVSLQNCRITNDGVAALARLDSAVLRRMDELDISYNRSIHDDAILSVYHRLRRDSDPDASGRVRKPLVIHVHQTAVSRQLATLIRDLVSLTF